MHDDDGSDRASLMGRFLTANTKAFVRRVVRTTASGRKTAEYTWGGEGRCQFYKGWMAMKTDAAVLQRVTGSEQFPGELLHHGGSVPVAGNLEPGQPNYWNTCHPKIAGRRPDQPLPPTHYDPAHILNCLRSHYIGHYDKFWMHNAPNKAAFDAMDKAAARLLQHNTIANKTSKFEAFMPSLLGMDTRIDLFDTLEMDGELYGSMAGTNHRSSFVTVCFATEQGDTVTWHAQVRCYIRHTLTATTRATEEHPQQQHSHPHDFAVLHYFTPTQTKHQVADEWSKFQWKEETLQKKKKKAGQETGAGGAAAAAAAAAPSSASYKLPSVAEKQYGEMVHGIVQSCEPHQLPVLRCAHNPPDLTDLMPVHRICGRWIPATSAEEGRAKTWAACPIPSKRHA